MAAGCQVETVRYYEREGLLPAPGRSAKNYRLYGQEHLERLMFIRHCRSFDISLDEVRRLLHFKDTPDENCAQVNTLLDAHIVKIGDRIRQLTALEAQMKDLRSRCDKTQASKDCRILQGLTNCTSEGLEQSPAGT